MDPSTSGQYREPPGTDLFGFAGSPSPPFTPPGNQDMMLDQANSTPVSPTCPATGTSAEVDGMVAEIKMLDVASAASASPATDEAKKQIGPRKTKNAFLRLVLNNTNCEDEAKRPSSGPANANPDTTMTSAPGSPVVKPETEPRHEGPSSGAPSSEASTTIMAARDDIFSVSPLGATRLPRVGENPLLSPLSGFRPSVPPHELVPATFLDCLEFPASRSANYPRIIDRSWFRGDRVDPSTYTLLDAAATVLYRYNARLCERMFDPDTEQLLMNVTDTRYSGELPRWRINRVGNALAVSNLLSGQPPSSGSKIKATRLASPLY
jgi:hypothetical protein